jgi:hypothetical protein
MLSCDLYESYVDLNETLAGWIWRESPCPVFSNDANVEDPVCMIGIRKWSWENQPEEGPNVGFLGLEIAEHVKVTDKYDVFICVRA